MTVERNSAQGSYRIVGSQEGVFDSLQTAYKTTSTTATTFLVAGVASNHIDIVGLAIHGAAANTLTLKSGSTAISGAIPLVANGNLDAVFPHAHNNAPWFKTITAGDSIKVTPSAAETAVYTIVYRLRD